MVFILRQIEDISCIYVVKPQNLKSHTLWRCRHLWTNPKLVKQGKSILLTFYMAVAEECRTSVQENKIAQNALAYLNEWVWKKNVLV